MNMMKSPDEIRKEFTVLPDGRIEGSRRAAARLSGVDESTLRYLLLVLREKAPSECLQPFVGGGFDGAGFLPDFLISAIVQHYALKGSKTAIMSLSAFAAIGLRTWVQKHLGWEEDRARAIVNLLTESSAQRWAKQFRPEYYEALYRLYDIKDDGSRSHPRIFGKFTADMVYSYLPDGVYERVRECRDRNVPYAKLHQFLSKEGLQVLHRHMDMCLDFMLAATSVAQFEEMLQRRINGVYQLELITSRKIAA